jgi:NADH-quinone oxidoreductase subunit H
MELLILIIKVAIVFQLVLGLASFCTWFERKGSALIQNRVGANRAGAYLYTNTIFLKPVFFFVRILGILGVINTLICDSIKGILKEDFIPSGVSPLLHSLGPFLAVLPIFIAFAFIPMAPNFSIYDYQVISQIAPVSGGVLFILAMGSVAVYGVTFAGWTGNNKFSLLGSLRAAAQMISYELPMGITFASVAVIYGSLDLYRMVELQEGFRWGVLYQPLSFIILFIVGFAETKRAPFDLPESESELVAGYFTEYSGMKFLLFWLGEFTEITLFSFLLVLLFFGGWNLPFIDLPKNVWWAALIGHFILIAKVIFFNCLQIVIRWTLPRFRYDQLMNLGWKYLLPLSLINLMISAALKLMMN